MEDIRSAMYLSGNKHLLIPKLIPHLSGKKILVEPFFGSGTVSLNCSYREMFDEYYCNDIHPQMMKLHEDIKDLEWIDRCKTLTEKYPPTKEGFYQIREDYNRDKLRSELVYLTMMRSHSNSIRFNKSGGLNITFGERERFDLQKMKVHSSLCQDFNLYNMSFLMFLMTIENKVDLSETVIYCDPPYQNSLATYQEGGAWTVEDDFAILSKLEDLRKKGTKIVYSNVFFNKGKYNQWLIDWVEERGDSYEVIHLDRNYNNCSSFKYDGKGTDEVLIVSK
ncbi:D12 class N6 adenine-specific DNA methyltransferase [Vibrio phage 1.170.O._10N.261.52.C3]|nr:D12 class N6 adenine-specific DNA methyltransferase [Vibrio phage 1.170.O._10N.261.52.C3]